MFTIHLLAEQGAERTICGLPPGIGMFATSNRDDWSRTKNKCPQCKAKAPRRPNLAVLYAKMEDSRMDHLGKASQKIKAARLTKPK